MSDLISRQGAIEAVIAQRHKAELSEHNFALRLAEDAIRHLPSAEVVLKTPQTYGKSINPTTEIMSDLISREDAIKATWDWQDLYLPIHFQQLLEELPPAVCDDCIWHVCNYNKVDWDGEDGYISRQDAMGAVQDHFNADGFKGYDDGQKMMDRIKALPSADRPTGRWEVVDATEPRRYGCSKCKRLSWDMSNYCPNCGCAMMKGGEE